tara:strand:+ start:527 stop:802 length:276 start_codon:yes stop_codon:yes gene_type:complete
MSRKITISKYKDNTHWSVEVEDKYGKLHHVGYSSILTPQFEFEVENKAKIIWANEVEPDEKAEIEAKAIKEMIDIGPKFYDNMGNSRDGLD